MLILRMIGARPDRNRRGWSAFDYGLAVALLVAIVTVGVEMTVGF